MRHATAPGVRPGVATPSPPRATIPSRSPGSAVRPNRTAAREARKRLRELAVRCPSASSASRPRSKTPTTPARSRPPAPSRSRARPPRAPRRFDRVERLVGAGDRVALRAVASATASSASSSRVGRRQLAVHGGPQVASGRRGRPRALARVAASRAPAPTNGPAAPRASTSCDAICSGSARVAQELGGARVGSLALRVGDVRVDASRTSGWTNASGDPRPRIETRRGRRRPRPPGRLDPGQRRGPFERRPFRAPRLRRQAPGRAPAATRPARARCPMPSRRRRRPPGPPAPARRRRSRGRRTGCHRSRPRRRRRTRRRRRRRPRGRAPPTAPSLSGASDGLGSSRGARSARSARPGARPRRVGRRRRARSELVEALLQ